MNASLSGAFAGGPLADGYVRSAHLQSKPVRSLRSLRSLLFVRFVRFVRFVWFVRPCSGLDRVSH